MNGCTGREIVGAALATYGSRTCVLVYNELENRVDELTLHRKVDQPKQDWHECHEGELVWTWQRLGLKFRPDCKIFSPGNTKCAGTNKAYYDALKYWLKGGYTLRYSGAMAADCYLVLIKGEGIFSSISSPAFGVPAKLRVLFECLPIAFLVTKAGGGASTGTQHLLDLEVTGYTQRTDIIVGSSNEVKRVEQLIEKQNFIRGSDQVEPDPQV
jgi:sedoheptulose-bisphosphatase